MTEKKAIIKKDLFGIFGYINLPENAYLILIEEGSFLG